MNNFLELINDTEYKTVAIPYYERLLYNFKSIILFYLFLLIVISLLSSVINAFTVFFCLVLFNFIEYSNWTKYYICHIKREGQTLTINYFFKNEIRIIEDVFSAFSFELKRVWYKKGKVIFLEVKHNDVTILKQFQINDIDEKVLLKLSTFGPV